MKNTTVVTAALLTAMSSMAYADFEATYVGLTGNGSVHIDNTGSGGFINQDFNAGHLEFTYTNSVTDGGERGDGQYASGSFRGFCLELQNVKLGAYSYEVDSISNAPNPAPGAGGPAYDAADEAEVNAVIAAAVRKGWINADLSANAATNVQLSAIQGQIWKVVFDNSVVTGNGAVATEMGSLQAEIALDPTATVTGLFAMLNAETQDQLFIVPLPTALFAGMLTLAGLGGISRVRRR